MKKKLGYTWYPKDWSSSDKVFELTLIERGLYRELIDMAMTSDNVIEVNIKLWARKFGSNIEEIEGILVTLEHLGLVTFKKQNLFVPSCESRLNIIRGGKKGGEISVKNKPTDKPTDKPMVKQREREREREKEREKENNINKSENSFPPSTILHKFDFKKELMNLGVEEKLVDEWLQIRKKKKAVNSETALKGLIRESKKAGITISDSVTLCVESSWQGFKAEWIVDKVKELKDRKLFAQHSTLSERAAIVQDNMSNLDWSEFTNK